MGPSDWWSYILGRHRRVNRLGVEGVRIRGLNPNPNNLALKSANAKKLLVNPVFNQAYAELLLQIQDSIAETKMEDAPLRESLYFQIRALVLVVTKLNHFAQEYELMVEKDKENKEDG